MVLPTGLMLYYAAKNWKEDHIMAKRLLLLGLGGISLSVGYATEMIGLNLIISTILRFNFFIAAALFYWALFKMQGLKSANTAP